MGATQFERNPLISHGLSQSLSSQDRALNKGYGTAPSCISLALSSEPRGSRSHSMLQILQMLSQFLYTKKTYFIKLQNSLH